MKRWKSSIDKRNIIFLIICVLIITLSAIYIYDINYLKDYSPYQAINGIIDLTDWDGQENIDLNGGWEFYPHALVNPVNKDLAEYNHIKKHVKVPGTWNSYLSEDGTAEGYGTYRLKIKLPKDGVYGIKTRTIRLASSIFANNEHIFSIGNPAPDKESGRPGSEYKVAMIRSENQELDLIIQVSSQEYRTGGIIKPIEFGSYQSIIKGDRIDRTIDGLVITSCIILSIYFFLTFLQRKNEVYILYFSATSLFMGLYLSTMNEQLLNLVHDYDFISRLRIQMFAMIMTTICFTRFVYFFFEEYADKRITDLISALMLIKLLLLLNNPMDNVSFTQGYVQLSILLGMLISYSYIAYMLFKALFNKAESWRYIVIIGLSMMIYWTLIVLKILYEFDLGYLPIALISTIMMNTAILMSYKHQLDYRKSNILLEQLIANDKLKDEFLAGVAHELRTPMHVILNLTESLIEGNKGMLNEKQQENLFFIDKEGKRLTRLVENLLDASHFDSQSINLSIKALDSYRLVESILVEMEAYISADKNVLLLNQIPTRFPALRADEDRFIQIIYNLLHNAIKYTDFGEITVSGHIRDEDAVIEVKDTGAGIKEEKLDKIFETFYREDNQETINQGTGGNGLGLGLAIVKQMVEIQGGHIEVSSSYGKGTIFSFSLPVYKDDLGEIIFMENTNEKDSKSDKIHGEVEKRFYANNSKYTILVVDDEVSNQRVILDIILEMGFNCIITDNGKEAIDIVNNNKIDLIVLDFMLPDISGAQVCGIVREKYSMTEIPVLILTASGRNTDIIDSFEYGANYFIKRPVNRGELKTRIESLLAMKESVKEGVNRELQYFASQISPHFLYNTLNTIIGLSYKDTELARQALNNLSIYFRGKLDVHREESLIPLDTELELVTAYLEIAQLRFGERIKVEYDIEEDVEAMIPPLTLQPLVENAIHHGLLKSDKEGWIKISVARKTDEYINIIIEDNGIGMSKERRKKLLQGESERIGFRNVVEKLKIVKNSFIDLESEEGKGTKVIITIPEVKAYEGYTS